MNPDNIQINESWKEVLGPVFLEQYFDNIVLFVKGEKRKGKTIYPSGNLIFNAFNTTPFDKVKVIILGQDPYHNPGQAMGLSFSVPAEEKIPPSLKNIYKEIKNDLNLEIPSHGNLTYWAEQGVLLLNAILTVEHKIAGSHKKIGWEKFTDRVIQILSDRKENLVFILWGNFARSKKQLIDMDKHLILESYHPSPLAGMAFFNNHHFSKTNNYLRQHNKIPIDWQIK